MLTTQSLESIDSHRVPVRAAIPSWVLRFSQKPPVATSFSGPARTTPVLRSHVSPPKGLGDYKHPQALLGLSQLSLATKSYLRKPRVCCLVVSWLFLGRFLF
jgi:hypothetical protein